jgi:hypothetical protein
MVVYLKNFSFSRGAYVELCFQGYNAVLFVESQWTFRSSEAKNNPNKIEREADGCACYTELYPMR